MKRWKAARVSADFYNNVQKDAGILLKTFDVSNPVEPKDEDIITPTTGGFSIACVPETQDIYEDIDNVPNNTAEGKDITGWTVTASTTAIGVTEDVIALSLGASETNLNGGISPRRTYEITDFKDLYWIGDMANSSKLLCAVIKNAVSTGGFSLQTSKNGKGQLALELTGHTKLNEQEIIPAEFYILEKVDDEE
jgi:hypothetical protein